MNFGKLSRSNIKDYIIKNDLMPYMCAECGIADWNGKPLSLHLDHIDGQNDNNQLDNLRFLCPNCHSQTDTYCGKNNIVKFCATNHKVTDSVLLESMRREKNPGHALKAVGLAGAGNYKRVYRLAEKHNIEHMKRQEKVKVAHTVCCKHCQNTFIMKNKGDNKKFCNVECREAYNKNNLNVNTKSPLYGVTLEEIMSTLDKLGGNYRLTGKHFGVSDNAIRKKILKEVTGVKCRKW